VRWDRYLSSGPNFESIASGFWGCGGSAETVAEGANCSFFFMGLMTTYEFDSILITVILGRLSGCLGDIDVFETKVEVVSVSEFKMLKAWLIQASSCAGDDCFVVESTRDRWELTMKLHFF
jgi:hypothetical protein